MAQKNRKHTENPTVSTHLSPLRTAIYLRISEVKPARLPESIESHLKMIKAFLAHRPDLTLAATYTDVNIGDSGFQRKGFQQMIKAVENGEVDCVIVKDISLFGRNPIEIGYYIEKCFLLHTRLILLSEQIKTVREFDSWTQKSITTHASEVIAPRSKLTSGNYIDHLRDQIVLLQHEICEVDLQIERQKFLIESLEPNVQQEIITPQESTELRSIFESKQSELEKVRDHLLKKIQWIKEIPTSPATA